MGAQSAGIGAWISLRCFLLPFLPSFLSGHDYRTWLCSLSWVPPILPSEYVIEVFVNTEIFTLLVRDDPKPLYDGGGFPKSQGKG